MDQSLSGQQLSATSRNAGYQFPHTAEQQQSDRIVDMRSDTLTQPTERMRQALATALVGDDVYGEDPSVCELERYAAQLFGMEKALFVPTGTMGNLIAVLVHCRQRSSEALLGDRSHIFLYEQGGLAQIGGVHPRTVLNMPDGTFLLSELESKIRVPDQHFPVSSVFCVENTHNVCGGKVLPLGFIDAIVAKSKEFGGIPVHCDGARLYNAAVALREEPERLLRGVASVSMCLSKSLSAPIGSLVGGSDEFIWHARRLRKVRTRRSVKI